MAAPVTLSKAGLRLYDQLAPLAYEDEQRSFALAHLCEAFIGGIQEVDDLARNYTETKTIERLTPSLRPWVPTDIAGCEILLHASMISGSPNDGDSVASWTDQSGGGRHGVQTTAARKPIKQTVTNGGKTFGVLRFDGVASPNSDLMQAPLVNNDATRTIFVVAKATGGGATGRGVAWNFTSSSRMGVGDDGASWNYVQNQGLGLVGVGGSATNFSCATIRFNSTSSADVYFNNSAATNFDPDNSYQDGTSSTFNISDDIHGWQGDQAVIIVFDSALSDANLNIVRNYLGITFGLGYGSLPPGVVGTAPHTVEVNTEKIGWSKLFDLDRIPDNAVPWLAQFVGVYEPRYAGEDDATYATRLKLLIADPIGFKRGTPNAIKKRVQDTLTGTKTVFFTERQGSAYTMAVATWTSETPNATVTANAARSQKPGGLIMNVSTIVGGDFQTLRDVHTDFLDVRTQFATFNDVRNNPSLT